MLHTLTRAPLDVLRWPSLATAPPSLTIAPASSARRALPSPLPPFPLAAGAAASALSRRPLPSPLPPFPFDAADASAPANPVPGANSVTVGFKTNDFEQLAGVTLPFEAAWATTGAFFSRSSLVMTMMGAFFTPALPPPLPPLPPLSSLFFPAASPPPVRKAVSNTGTGKGAGSSLGDPPLTPMRAR